MKNDSNILKYLDYIFDYAPIVMTVIVAAGASLYGMKSGLETNELLQVMLLILALLATSFLIDRFRVIKNIEQKIDKINSGDSNAVSFFSDNLPDLNQRLKSAKSISISGITLARTSNSFYNTFDQSLKKGVKIRLQVVNPEDKALDIITQRFQKHQNVVKLKRESYHALDNLHPLVVNKRIKGSLTLKHVNFAPPYGIWMIDENTSKAEIWVELYSFRDTPEPTFHLLPSRDKKWFDYFQNQFELMWENGVLWKPDNK
jgi:hypothetical protein